MNFMCPRLHMNSELLLLPLHLPNPPSLEIWILNLTLPSFYNFSKVWGDKYVTSNVQIVNPATGLFEYIGKQYRYFTTDHGELNFMSVRTLVLMYLRASNHGIWCTLRFHW